jgi:signal transduction histidine kinase
MAHELSDLLKENHQKEIQIKIKTEGSMEVTSDRSIYKHILQNLISNAVKYSKDHTKIGIQLRNDGNFIYFTVKDQGIGIPLDEQDRILEFMYRASNSEMANGSGLGLALVKQCVETLYGTISMQSKQNEGTTFNVILPLKLSS